VDVTFWGTRGSIAKAGPDTVRYGGNTSCVEVRSDAGTLVVVDCGTGGHGLGQHLIKQANGAPVDGHILVSHTHWDHIQGLPFFAPLFQPGCTWQISGPSGLGGSLSEILAGQMEYTYFPVAIDQLAASVVHQDLVEGTFEIADIGVETRFLNHPALTLGYRLEADGAVVVYASDHEPHDHELAVGRDVDHNRHDLAHADWLEGADLLIHDAQYLASEYSDHVGWGHSTVEYAIDVARSAGVARVALYHHDPNRTDDAVDELLAVARAHALATGYDGEVFAAAEGTTITVRGDSARRDRLVARRSASPAATAARGSRSNSVVVCAPTEEVARVLISAGRAEGLDVTVADDLRSAFDAVLAHRPGIVLAEAVDDDGGFDLVAAIRDLDDPALNGVPVIMVGARAARWRSDALETGITEWLVWPASAFFVRTKLRAWLLRRANKWQNAPLPPDEDARLAALRDLAVLDTAPEARFDRHTKEISALIDIPIALISLVDADRQWFKSHIGVAVRETPRDMSLCAHAILGDELLEVPDALADPRFADNPLVIGEPRLRFYAGVPLVLDSGARVGTLCVADTRPRKLDVFEIDHLRRIARSVVDELEGAQAP
jgi:phosphoribosyl 1,2-cyclic phosphodiesterase/DNA-binding response OmpR family regulator